MRRAPRGFASRALGASGMRFRPALGFLLRLVVGSAVVVGSAAAEDPKNGESVGPTSASQVEGLGFSIAPKEGGEGRTSFFGVVGEGYKFVFVLDRSGSMGGTGRASLRAVKTELARSLANLDTVHQFQIVFYNERPVVFNPSGAAGRLAFATEANKHRALRFIDAIPAEGGTAHEDALRLAIQLHPDVIFFLTDADEPELTARQLSKIRERAAGIVVHAIEFGSGPQRNKNNFLEELASQNGGRHVYVDVAKLSNGADGQ